MNAHSTSLHLPPPCHSDPQWPSAPPSLTYSHPDQPRLHRLMIRTVERLTGQRKLERLYSDWATWDRRRGESPFEAALRLLRLSIRIEGQAALAALPRTGGLLLIANHPYGVIDGLALGQLAMALRGNAHILTNKLLCGLPEMQPHLLPVDFSGSRQAQRLTGETRRRAAQLLIEGQTVAIFPAGGIATAKAPLSGRALEATWHPFLGRLATLPGVTTLPVHLQGQNSRLFQLASHLSYPLRLALTFHETRRRISSTLDLRLGMPIPAKELQSLNRAEVAQSLRRRTMALARPYLEDPDEVFQWPAHLGGQVQTP